MQLITDELLIQGIFRMCGKYFTKRYVINTNYPYKICSILLKQKCSSKITSMVMKALHNWILTHDHVKELSCCNNYIKIKPHVGDGNFSVTKIYLQVPIQYLYYDMIKPPSLGGLNEAIDSNKILIISNSKLREFLQPKVQIISKQIEYLCGCKKLF